MGSSPLLSETTWAAHSTIHLSIQVEKILIQLLTKTHKYLTLNTANVCPEWGHFYKTFHHSSFTRDFMKNWFTKFCESTLSMLGFLSSWATHIFLWNQSPVRTFRAGNLKTVPGNSDKYQPSEPWLIMSSLAKHTFYLEVHYTTNNSSPCLWTNAWISSPSFEELHAQNKGNNSWSVWWNLFCIHWEAIPTAADVEDTKWKHEQILQEDV